MDFCLCLMLHCACLDHLPSVGPPFYLRASILALCFCSIVLAVCGNLWLVDLGYLAVASRVVVISACDWAISACLVPAVVFVEFVLHA